MGLLGFYSKYILYFLCRAILFSSMVVYFAFLLLCILIHFGYDGFDWSSGLCVCSYVLTLVRYMYSEYFLPHLLIIYSLF